MELNNIRQFLEKYRLRLFGQEEKRRLFVSLIKECTRIEIGENQLTVKNGTAYLAVDAVTRSEIFLHKERILALAKANNLAISAVR